MKTKRPKYQRLPVMRRGELLKIMKNKQKYIWVCFDEGNMHYLWWYRTRKEARERRDYQNNRLGNTAKLTKPIKLMIMDNNFTPHDYG